MKMKTLSIRTIFVALLLAVGISYLIPFVHTLLDLLTGIRLPRPLTAYILWGYSPVIVAGIYIDFSGVRGRVLNGVLAGALFYLIVWLTSNVLIPSPYFIIHLNLYLLALDLCAMGLYALSLHG